MPRSRPTSPSDAPGARLAALGWRAAALGALGLAVFLALRLTDGDLRGPWPRELGIALLAAGAALGPALALLALASWRREGAALARKRGRGQPPERPLPPRGRASRALDLAALLLAVGGAALLGRAARGGALAAALAAPAAVLPAVVAWSLARAVAVRERSRAPRTAAAAPPARAAARPAPTAAAPAPAAAAAAARPTPASEGTVDARWIPPGAACEIAGRTLPDGMVYVGTWLPSARDPEQPEPALLRPDLSIDDRAGDAPASRDPVSYSELPPAGRAAHLDWLAGGRDDPEAALGTVWLFFQGLERRLLLDARTEAIEPAEVEVLCAELRRLHGVYHGHRAFRARVERLLDYAELEFLSERPLSLPPPDAAPTRELPARLRLALARAFVRGEALDAGVALAWAAHAAGGKLPAAARRARPEFERLFRAHYPADFARRFAPPRDARGVVVRYEPASPSLRGQQYEASSLLPDLAGWSEPREALARLVETCAEDLAAFARWRARHPERSPDLAALSGLPRALLRERDDPLLRGLVASLETALGDDAVALFPVRGLFLGWSGLGPSGPSRRDCARIAELVGKLGYGVEPDVRFGGPRLRVDERCALFRLTEGAPQAPSAGYAAATLVTHLAALVSGADGGERDDERSELDRHLDRALDLDPAERERIEAHRAWLLAGAPRLGGLKRRVEGLSAAQRERLGRFAVQVAGADGRVAPAEVAVLERIHALLGLDPGRVHAELHALATAARAASPSGYDEEQAVEARGVELDPDLVRAKLRETAQVSALLQDVFREDEDADDLRRAADAASAAAPDAPDDAPLAGLDATHSALLRALAGRARWPRVELEELADRLGLLLDGALDRLNEAAFERCDAALWEGDEEIEIDMQTAQELTR